ncbi:DNA-binding response regulator, OmpR family, contains REC and winged-helix (wHTH) domain [Sporobacter termitidis DSM 10068]|uniref:Stage 0 sporulation protein A homolog n=1 Tax=Sporobacter termitidis DSM 10068 TaxID=1123282 RepID=A0A1M5Z985_9FIRM|nr:response regulator transcription factor [Sporobacter termitidis]SHI20774.1 DNA-binding response regulator, OmpR family, contains REC and winged-helix (wHTH) domain [Sporobacter termitidis DSM 10068]
MKILLVEDEEELSDIVARGLTKCGYAIDRAYDGEEALDYYRVVPYDVIVLDLNLPKVDGLDVLRAIRLKDKRTKILILSARSDVADRVLGLDLGANDYLTKPFDFLELEARIRTLTRIAYIQQGNVLTCGELRLNMASRLVAFGDVKMTLTKKEFAILEYMMLNPGQVMRTEQLVDHAWGSDEDLYPDTLKYHIHSIKKKLTEAGCKKPLIANVRGMGYKIGEADT